MKFRKTCASGRESEALFEYSNIQDDLFERDTRNDVLSRFDEKTKQ